MHGFISILCMHFFALALANPCNDIGTKWTADAFLAEQWAYFLQAQSPQPPASYTTALNEMISAGQGTQNPGSSTCNYPVYIMCPALNEGEIEEQFKKKLNNAAPWQTKAYNDALAAQEFKGDHHIQIVEQFAKVLNWDQNAELTAAQKSLQTQFIERFGGAAQRTNSVYFTFRSNFTDIFTPQARFKGPDFDFSRYAQRNDLQRLTEDRYMNAYAYLHLLTTKGQSNLAESDFKAGYDAFAARVLVSRNVNLCWSLLLSGLPPRDLTREDIVPAAYQGDKPQLWNNRAVAGCSCGPTSTELNGDASAYESCDSLGLDGCKTKCILYSGGTCYGVLYSSEGKKGYIVVKNDLPNLFECSSVLTPHDVCLEYKTHAQPSELAFHSAGTSNETYTLAPKYSYELTNSTKVPHTITDAMILATWLASGCTATDANGPYIYQARYKNINNIQKSLDDMVHWCHNANEGKSEETQETCCGSKDCGASLTCKQQTHFIDETASDLRTCMDQHHDMCYVTTSGVHPMPPADASSLLRTYARRGDNTPARCESRCMLDAACLAWTWDSTRCKITTGIGKQTHAAMPANLEALRAMELATDHHCEDGQAFDLCSQQCVDINNALEMGWCNHNWVNCKDGPHAVTPPPKDGERMCVGGSMPDDKGERFTPLAGTKKICSTNSLICAADAAKRTQVSSSEFEGAFMTKDDTCGTVGASLANNENPEYFGKWQSYSDATYGTKTDTYMVFPPAAKDTYTYVTAAKYTDKGENGNAYASTAGGMLSSGGGSVSDLLPSDCGENGHGVCIFPVCMFCSSNL